MVEMMRKQCLECNTPIRVRVIDHNRGQGKFCSISCSSTHHGKQSRAKRGTNCVCAQCSKKFYRNKSKQSLSKSGLQFCSRKCKDIAQRIDGLKEIHPPHYRDGRHDYRKIAFRSHERVCNRCGYHKLPGILIVHHRDRDRTNNTVENLEVLCPNCHEEDHFIACDGRFHQNH